ncbi:MAG: beta-lactamase domain protein [Gemmatimonadetes bacterium]|nr:beta-lactamase domain protein [Gemmatimonadota bacterium]
MILKRFYDDKLAQASYLVGCEATRQALVVDPNRDAAAYLAAAEAEGLRVTHVTETHVHADFVSGSRELARAAGAELLLSAEGDAAWGYTYAASEGATALRDGGSFRVGQVRVDVMHTPGHTPEHLTFLVTDGAAADRPMGAFTGDFVFVGDVGRPDLLEKAVRVEGSAETAARELFRSVRRFAALPDYLQLWPGHGAGSACGKALGAVPQTTLGYERLFNPAFQQPDEAAFARLVLAGQPEPPRYFAQVKRINRDGPPPLDGFPRPARMPDRALANVLAEGAPVLDTCSTSDFAAGAVPGTLNVPLNRAFNTWAGWLLPYDRGVYLVVDEERVDEAVRDLAFIGLDRVAGWFAPSAVPAWAQAHGALQTVPQTTAAELAGRMRRGEVSVVDVRGAAEWRAGHLPGVPNVPVGELVDRLAELPVDRPIVVQCQGGARSAIAASVLHAHGVRDVVNLAGGFAEWLREGLPVETEMEVEPVPA